MRNRTVRSYHFKTGKSALAHDEWLEVCNRDFSLLPGVRTLLGMCRQGSLIGVAKRCKRASDMFFGPGEMGETKVHRSGTGAKGNGGPEKRLMYQVVTLFLGTIVLTNPAPRQLLCTSVKRLKKDVTTKLDKSVLNKERFFTGDDTATRMFNGVSHVFNAIRVDKEAHAELEAEVEWTDEENEPDQEKELELRADERLEMEERAMEEAMDGIVFDEEETEENNENAEASFEPGKFMCLQDLWEQGWEAIGKMGVKQIREAAVARMERKRELTKYIIKKVREMKEDSAAVPLGSEMESTTPAQWCDYIHSLRPEYYN